MGAGPHRSHARHQDWRPTLITRDQMMPMLLTACPSFAQPWQAYVEGPGYEDDLLYLHLNEFASHVVGLLKEGQTTELDAVFAVVETLHKDGDRSVCEAATIGILEGVQNIAESSGFDAESFVPYLGKESASWWRRLKDFWK
jgi:hypothetical protein